MLNQTCSAMPAEAGGISPNIAPPSQLPAEAEEEMEDRTAAERRRVRGLAVVEPTT